MGYVKTVIMLTASIGLFAVGVTLVTLGGLLRLQSGLLSDNVVLLLNSISYNNIYIGINLLAMSYGSLIIGGLLMISSIAGCCGGYKRVKWILIIVVIINVLLMLAQFCLLGITVSLYGKMNEWFKGQLITQFKTYDGPFSSSVLSLGFNYMFMEGRCCGINPQYSNGATNNDFSTTTWWNSNTRFGSYRIENTHLNYTKKRKDILMITLTIAYLLHNTKADTIFTSYIGSRYMVYYGYRIIAFSVTGKCHQRLCMRCQRQNFLVTFTGVHNLYKETETIGSTENLPASCCQGATASNLGSYVSSAQCGAVSPPINFYTAGCFNYIKETVSYNTYVIGAMTGLMLIFMVLLLISVCGLWNDQKNQVEAITNSTPPPLYKLGATRRKL